MIRLESSAEPNESSLFAESVGLLWEGTKRVTYGGIDTDDLAVLCSIVVRVAEHRLLRLQSSVKSSESARAIEQLQNYRESALKLISSMNRRLTEPDWDAIAERLASVGATPLDFQK